MAVRVYEPKCSVILRKNIGRAPVAGNIAASSRFIGLPRERRLREPTAAAEAAPLPAAPEEWGGKISLSVSQLCSATSFGKSLIYEEVKAGRLPLRKIGKRSVVLVSDALAWIRGETGAPVRRSTR